MSQWYVSRNGKQHGPIGYAQLVANAQAGWIVPTDLVWKEGMLEWLPAGQVGGLFDSRSPTPPLLPQAAPPGIPATSAYAGPQTAPSDIGQDPGVRLLIPVGRSGWAIASGYLGLLSVLLIFAPFALLTGIIALGDMRKHPHKHGAGRAWFGIVMGGLFSVPLAFMLVVMLLEVVK
jgi:hypothetical protein